VLWDWMGLAWLVLPLSLPAWSRHLWRTPVLFLLTTTLAVFTLMFVPPVTTLLQPRLGYLLMRMVWILPLAMALAFAVDAMLLRLVRPRWGERASAVAAAVVLACLLAAPVGDALARLTNSERVREEERTISTLRWREPMRWIDAHLPAGTVVLSDPATSYAVPMWTRHHVVTLVDQHGTPNDPFALDRILDARDALDPQGTWRRLREVKQRWGATAIVLNDRFDEVPRLDYWAPDPSWFRSARARLDAQPAAFPRQLDSGDLVVYAIRSPALDSLVAATDTAVALPPPSAVGRPRAAAVADGVDLQRFALSSPRAAPGDTVRVDLDWVARRRLPAGQYDAFLRFERELPAGQRPPALIAKPVRKLLERSRGERYRFRHDHTPTSGVRGVDRWLPGEVVADSAIVVVPRDAALGAWQVQVRLARQPHYPNYWLQDYFLDRDYYSGVAVDTLLVVAPGTPRGGH